MTEVEQSGNEASETTNEKGDRHENEARHILKRVYGAGVSKVGCRGVHDPFGFVDLIAMRPGEPVKFVQVKTNGFSAEARRKYRRRTRKLPTEHAVLEVWVRHDRQGWVLHEYDPEAEEFHQFHEINVCDRSDAGDEYREFVQRQEQLVTDGGTNQPRCHDCGRFCGEAPKYSGSSGQVLSRSCLHCGINVPDCAKETGTVYGCQTNATHRGSTEPNRREKLWCEEHAPEGSEPLPYVEDEFVGTKRVVTDGGYDVAIISDEFVRSTAAPTQEAESWCFVEIDDPAEEASGYWFPCRLPRSDVGDDRDAVPDPDQLAHDDVLQFPLESRQPELAGGALPPEGTKDRVVEDPLDDFLPED